MARNKSDYKFNFVSPRIVGKWKIIAIRNETDTRFHCEVSTATDTTTCSIEPNEKEERGVKIGGNIRGIGGRNQVSRTVPKGEAEGEAEDEAEGEATGDAKGEAKREDGAERVERVARVARGKAIFRVWFKDAEIFDVRVSVLRKYFNGRIGGVMWANGGW